VKKTTLLAATLLLGLLAAAPIARAFFWGNGTPALTPKNDRLEISLKEINDGRAHHYQVRATDGTNVTFFVLKSSDGVFRAAIDSCDVCYQSGKGYHQEGDFMVCENCGQKFASARVNEVKGGCNPAPLARTVENDRLVIAMADINSNSWYMRYRQK